jgi:hypothetical protein
MSSLSTPSKLFLSNSYDFDNAGVPSSNFINIFPSPIIGASEFRVVSCEIDNVFPTFSQYDNQLKITDNNGTYTLSIPTNVFYRTPDQLASDLQLLFNTATSKVYAVAFDTTLMRFRITPPDEEGYTFSFEVVSNSAYERLGYWDVGADVFTNSTAALGSNFPELIRTHALYIAADLGSSTYSPFGRTDIIAKIPVNVPYGNVIFFQGAEQYLSIGRGNFISRIQLELLDDFGRPIDTNHISLEFEMKYDYETTKRYVEF